MNIIVKQSAPSVQFCPQAYLVFLYVLCGLCEKKYFFVLTDLSLKAGIIFVHSGEWVIFWGWEIKTGRDLSLPVRKDFFLTAALQLLRHTVNYKVIQKAPYPIDLTIGPAIHSQELS